MTIFNEEITDEDIKNVWQYPSDKYQFKGYTWNKRLKRIKYEKKTVDEQIEISRDFSDFAAKVGQRVNKEIMCCPRSDERAYEDFNGKKKRYCDAELVYKTKRIWLEMKDIARFLYFNATGLPRDYIHKIGEFGYKNICLIWTENDDWVREKAKILNKNPDCIYDSLIRNGFAKEKDNKIYFIPYGNNLEVLMQEDNRELIKENDKKYYSKFKGEHNRLQQYIWKVNPEVMLPIPKIIKKYLIDEQQ